jgi:putative transcription antitermination factor YqgF
MRRGVRVAVDVGSVRIGVARSDLDGVLAVPVETVPRGPGDLARLAELTQEWSALELVVGLPRRLAGDEGPAAATARAFAAELAACVDCPVRLVDERLTTVSAQRDLHQAGKTQRSSRAVIDQAAAVVLLQDALDAEQSSGRPPGELVAHGEAC